MSALRVELYGVLLGTLTPRENGLQFEISQEALEHYPVASTIMSLAVPLNLRYTAPQKKRCMNFFNELLPEGRNLRWLARSLPPAERNTYGLLRKYGKDSAGALTIHDPDDPDSSKAPEAEKIDQSKVRYLLEHMPEEPLANSLISGKASLGGVQGKILLARREDSWSRTHYGYPSTHILKPVVAEYPSMIYDEAFSMQLAQKAGLTDHPVWIESFDGLDALVIERFDRDRGVPGDRVHQEDFNQALGACGDQKYQETGGRVSAKRIAQTLSRFGSEKDVTAFASQLIFAVAVGNLDMHAKNISIFHLPDATIHLTPAYDQVPLCHQNTDGRTALALGGEYVHANLTLACLTTELVSWKNPSFSNESSAASFIEERLEAYRDALGYCEPHSNAYPHLVESIAYSIERLLSGRSIGRFKEG